MKGKTTWKPKGLRAKHWREAAHVKGRAEMPVPRPMGREGFGRTVPQGGIRPRHAGV
jgi:hypothetical protein